MAAKRSKANCARRRRAKTKRRILVFRAEHNSHGKRDVTGAFAPEASRFMKAVATSGDIVPIDNRKPMSKRRTQVLTAMEAAEGTFDGIAFFCHGWLDGIQCGFQRRHAPILAKAIWDLTSHDLVNVPLYCCSTGDDPHDKPLEAAGTGDDSFADRLRDALCAQGAQYCRVMGHTTVAHTTKNPHALFFDGMGSPVGGVGGYPPVGRKPRTLWTAWRKALRETDLRFRFPFMTVADIHAELGAGG